MSEINRVRVDEAHKEQMQLDVKRAMHLAKRKKEAKERAQSFIIFAAQRSKEFLPPMLRRQAD